VTDASEREDDPEPDVATNARREADLRSVSIAPLVLAADRHRRAALVRGSAAFAVAALGGLVILVAPSMDTALNVDTRPTARFPLRGEVSTADSAVENRAGRAGGGSVIGPLVSIPEVTASAQGGAGGRGGGRGGAGGSSAGGAGGSAQGGSGGSAAGGTASGRGGNAVDSAARDAGAPPLGEAEVILSTAEHKLADPLLKQSPHESSGDPARPPTARNSWSARWDRWEEVDRLLRVEPFGPRTGAAGDATDELSLRLFLLILVLVVFSWLLGAAARHGHAAEHYENRLLALRLAQSAGLSPREAGEFFTPPPRGGLDGALSLLVGLFTGRQS